MSYLRKNLTLAFATCSLVISSASWSAIDPVYVSTTGNDSNPGTLSQPYRTIKKGIDMLQPGGTLYLRGGTYVEPSITVPATKNGPSDANRTIIASYPGERAIFKPTSANQHGLNFTSGNQLTSNLTLSSFTVDFALKNIELQGKTSIGNLKMYWVTNLTLTNMHFLNNTNGQLTQLSIGGTTDRGPGGNILVSSCLFSNVTRQVLSSGHLHSPCHHMYWSTFNNVTIENNTFADGRGRQNYPIHNYGGIRTTNWVVRNNYFTNCDNGMYFYSRDPLVYNNLLVDIRGTGIGRGRLIGGMFANNTIYTTVGSSGSRGIYGESYGGVFINNIVWGNWSSGLMTDSGKTSYWTNNVASTADFSRGSAVTSGNIIGTQNDPRFINAPHDLRIGPNSAAAGNGVNLITWFAYDHLGRSRPNTGAWDLGAFVYGGGGQANQPPSPPRGFTESR